MKVKNKQNNILKKAILIFLGVYLFVLGGGFYLCNAISVSDLKLNNTSIPLTPNTSFSMEELGLSDKTLAEVIEIMQKFLKPDTNKVLKNIPGKKDVARLEKDLAECNINHLDLRSIADKTAVIDKPLVLTDREISLLSDSLLVYWQAEEFFSVKALFGQDSVKVESIYLNEKDSVLKLNIYISVKIDEIRNIIFQNLGYPIFHIGDKLYFETEYIVSINNGVFSGQKIKTVMNGLEEELFDKLLKVLFETYYLKEIKDIKEVFSYQNLTGDLFNYLSETLNSFGNVSISSQLTGRSDITDSELYFKFN